MEIEGRHIPNRLQEHRTIHGYRLKDVAHLLGHKNTNQVGKWENGEGMPGLVNLIRLSIIYSTLPTDLYFDVLKEQQEYIATNRQTLFVRAK